MSDRERAREIVERLAYDEELDRNGQEALIATALAQARAEGLRQAAEVLKEAHDHMHRLCAIIPGNDEAYRINVELMARLRALAEGGE